MRVLVPGDSPEGDSGKSGAGWAHGCLQSTLSSLHVRRLFHSLKLERQERSRVVDSLGQGTMSRQFHYQFSGFFSSLTHIFGLVCRNEGESLEVVFLKVGTIS